MRTVFETMGTVASLETSDAPHELITAITGIFESADRRFSLYRADSELSQVAAGSLALSRASDELRASYARAMHWRAATSDAFSPNRPDGTVDLNGIVKAEAIERAGAALRAAGVASWWLDVGGDVLTGGEPLTVGIVDPADRQRTLCAVTVHTAIATSGSAERGDHIWGARTAEFAQVSVVAHDIVTADVLATAIVSGGRAMLDYACDHWPIDVLAIDRLGAMVATPGLRAALAV